MDLCKQAPVCNRPINDFNRYESELKSMKKSSHFYCSNLNKEDRVLKTEEEQSVASSISSNLNSINFT